MQSRILIALAASTAAHACLMALPGQPPMSRKLFEFDAVLLEARVASRTHDTPLQQDPDRTDRTEVPTPPPTDDARRRSEPVPRAATERAVEADHAPVSVTGESGRRVPANYFVSVYETVEPELLADGRTPAAVFPRFRSATGLDGMPMPLRDIQPDDPRRRGAPLARVEVRLLVLIDEAGSVVDAVSWFVDTDPAYVNAARQAVLATPFSPGLQQGRPVAVRVPLVVRFGYE